MQVLAPLQFGGFIRGVPALALPHFPGPSNPTRARRLALFLATVSLIESSLVAIARVTRVRRPATEAKAAERVASILLFVVENERREYDL